MQVSSEVITRLVLARLADQLASTPILMSHHDDPIGGGAFVRLHPVLEGPRTSNAAGPDCRGVQVRCTAQVPASSLRADGYALHALADLVRNALGGARLSGEGHRLDLHHASVTVRSADPNAQMVDAQIDAVGHAQRQE